MTTKPKKIEADVINYCIPLVASTIEEILEQVEKTIEAKPEYIEFRRDYFKGSTDQTQVLQALKKARDEGIGVIYTYRGYQEGGQIPAEDEVRAQAIKEAIDFGACDYVDLEYSSDKAYQQEIAEALEGTDVGIIRSFHNFEKTPEFYEILHQLYDIAETNPDVVKVAYFCRNIDDVLSLQYATEIFREHWPEEPLIVIGMGDPGVITRLIPEFFFSSITFCSLSSDSKSAPGQEDIDFVRRVRSD